MGKLPDTGIPSLNTFMVVCAVVAVACVVILYLPTDQIKKIMYPCCYCASVLTVNMKSCLFESQQKRGLDNPSECKCPHVCYIQKNSLLGQFLLYSHIVQSHCKFRYLKKLIYTHNRMVLILLDTYIIGMVLILIYIHIIGMVLLLIYTCIRFFTSVMECVHGSEILLM